MALVLDGTTGIVSANIADGAVVSSKIADGTISASDLASGAVLTNTMLSTGKVQKFLYGNAAPNAQPIYASFTLSEAEAPIGSWVALGLEVMSGSSSGQQYCQLYQRDISTGGNAWVSGYVTGWYFYDSRIAWFYINDAADRTFHTVHGTISYTNNNDFRRVYYYGYAKVTQ